MPSMTVRQWIADRWPEPGFADQHIDYFATEWREKDRWIEGSLAVLEAAQKAIASLACGRRLAILYSLQTDYQSGSDFRQFFDAAPPSLFIAEPGCEPWVTSRRSAEVRMTPLSRNEAEKSLSTPLPFDCSLMEYMPAGTRDIVKSLWLIPRGTSA